MSPDVTRDLWRCLVGDTLPLRCPSACWARKTESTVNLPKECHHESPRSHLDDSLHPLTQLCRPILLPDLVWRVSLSVLSPQLEKSALAQQQQHKVSSVASESIPHAICGSGLHNVNTGESVKWSVAKKVTCSYPCSGMRQILDQISAVVSLGKEAHFLLIFFSVMGHNTWTLDPRAVLLAAS